MLQSLTNIHCCAFSNKFCVKWLPVVAPQTIMQICIWISGLDNKPLDNLILESTLPWVLIINSYYVFRSSVVIKNHCAMFSLSQKDHWSLKLCKLLYTMATKEVVLRGGHFQLMDTVWPQPIWKKVRSWWEIPPQHQSTYLGGPESASVEIPAFRPHFIKFQKKFFLN